METIETAWVLGHKIRRWDTDNSYGLIEVTSPPKEPGPPPHYHKAESEFFLILKGSLDVMVNGAWQTLKPGGFLDLPANTTHTFINNTEEDVVWITGWRPKGFQQFFRDFGIPVDQSGAREQSVSPALVQQVVAGSERYGMYVSR